MEHFHTEIPASLASPEAKPCADFLTLLLATSFHPLHCLRVPQAAILRISRSGLLPWAVSIYGRMRRDA